jgi:hypothetical protein
MSRKNIIKLLLDICIIILFVLMYNTGAINMTFHEIGGLVLLGIIIIHMIVNLKSVTISNGSASGNPIPMKSKINYILYLLLILAMILIGVSGIFISRVVFKLSVSSFPWRTIHYTSSAVALILVGIHIGIHRQFLLSTINKLLPLPKKIGTVIGLVLTLLLVSYGGYSIATTSFLDWLTMPFSSQQIEGRMGNMPSFDGGGNGNAQGWNGNQDGDGTKGGNPGGDDGQGWNGDQGGDGGQAGDQGSDGGQAGDQGGDGGQGNPPDRNISQGSTDNNDTSGQNRGSRNFGGFTEGEMPYGNNQSTNIFTILKTIAEFFSIIFLFATATAFIEILINKISGKNANIQEVLVDDKAEDETGREADSSQQEITIKNAATNEEKATDDDATLHNH